jgi:hypothetical protein
LFTFTAIVRPAGGKIRVLATDRFAKKYEQEILA